MIYMYFFIKWFAIIYAVQLNSIKRLNYLDRFYSDKWAEY